MRIRGLLAVALAAALVTGACDGGGGTTPTTSASATGGRIASTGSIRLLAPEPGASVEAPVTVRVALEGARLAEEVSSDIRPDEGHIHVKLDGETITLLAGLEYTIEDIEPGPHVLEVEFAAADHGPFNPRVLQTVAFTVT
jgi:hypothetical protein